MILWLIDHCSEIHEPTTKKWLTLYERKYSSWDDLNVAMSHRDAG